MRVRGLFLPLVAVMSACQLFDGDSVDRYELVNIPASIAPPADGSLRLFASGRIEWLRVYDSADAAAHTVSGRYVLSRDSLRVSWASDYWYTLGVRHGDTVIVAYAGAADEPHREFYVRR